MAGDGETYVFVLAERFGVLPDQIRRMPAADYVKLAAYDRVKANLTDLWVRTEANRGVR